MKRIFYIDGLRGIAVLMVLFFHLNLFEEGFSGVELFFVISGYIITYLLFSEQANTGKISLKSFYKRRISRIYPPLIVVVLASIILFLNFPIAGITESFSQEALYTSLGITNWYEVLNTKGYWENGVKSPLLHMWSIAIEIQFYLFWPALLKGLFKFDKQESKKLLLPSLLLLIVTFFLITFYFSYHSDFNQLYYSTQTRVVSFLVGALFASFSSKSMDENSNESKVTLISYLLTLGIIVGVFWFKLNSIALFRGEIFLFTVLTGALLFVLNQEKQFNFVKRILENPLLLYIGKISYSLYLWHIPVIIFLTSENIQNITGLTVNNSSLLIALQIVLSFTLAMLSNILVEQHIRFKSLSFALLVAFLFPAGVKALQSPQVIQHFKVVDSQPEIDQKWQGGDPIVVEGNSPLLIVGDSWSRRIGFGLDIAQKSEKQSNYQLLVYGVGNASIMDPDYLLNDGAGGKTTPYKSFKGYLYSWNQAINKYHPKKVLLITGNADQSSMIVNGNEIRVGSREFEEQYLSQFSQVIEFFRSKGIKVYLTNVPNNAHTGADKQLNATSTAMNKLIEKAVQASTDDVKLLNLRGLLSNGTQDLSPKIINNQFVYDATNHPSYDGSMYIGKWLLKELENK